MADTPAPGSLPHALDEAAAVLAALPWAPPSARQVTETAAAVGWLPETLWLVPALPAPEAPR